MVRSAKVSNHHFGRPQCCPKARFSTLSFHPIHLDYCTPSIAGPCGPPWTTQQQMDKICQMEGYCEAVDWEIELIYGGTCFCWMGEWVSPCCSGGDNRFFVTQVTCD